MGRRRIELRETVRKEVNKREIPEVFTQAESSQEYENNWKMQKLVDRETKMYWMAATKTPLILRTKVSTEFYRKLLQDQVSLRSKSVIRIKVKDVQSERESPKTVSSKKEDHQLIPQILLDEEHKIVNGIYEHLEIRESSIHGKGIYANIDIEEKTFLMEYKGEIIGKCVANKREKIYQMCGIQSVYMFKVDDDKIIDATLIGNKARYMNHSCDPNCYAVTDGKRKVILYFTRRHVQAGEELTIDYNISSEFAQGEICNCGSSKCNKNV